MPHNNDELFPGLKELIEEGEIQEDLYNTMVRIAEQHMRSGAATRNGAPPWPYQKDGGAAAGESVDTAEDHAADFLVYMRQSPVTARRIRTIQDLRRAYKKWITEKREPGRKELWHIISAALLDLEKSGTVERAKRYRGYHNSNDVLWALAGHGGRPARPLEESEIDAVVPALSAKYAERKILSPTEAREIIVRLLSCAAGDVSMREIVEYLASRLPLLRIRPAASALPDEEAHAESNPIEDLPGSVAHPAMQRIIAEEVSFRSRKIWENVSAIRRGVKTVVEGLRILCCYFLPTAVFRKKIRLKDFGPTSTVQDVVNDIREVMGRYLGGLSQSEVGSEHVHWPAKEIARGVLTEISRQCSENGYCTPFV